MTRLARMLGACFLSGLIGLGTGCASSPGRRGEGMSGDRYGPFILRLPKTVAWTDGKPRGFDPGLPGYHFTGDIASVRLAPAQRKLPEKLVLAITTSPGAEPHLDHFRLSVRGGHIQVEPFNEKVPTRVTWTGRERNAFRYAETGTYFDFRVVGSEVLVIFKPAVMELLNSECMVSWIDWYR